MADETTVAETARFTYASGAARADYRCMDCGAHGVKLWRIGACSAIELRCADCARVYPGQSFDTGAVDGEGRCNTYMKNRDGSFYALRGDQLGSCVPAVPAEDEGWYGYTSVPEDGVRWWRGLPTRAPERTRALADDNARLRKLLWCALHVTDDAACARVAPAAIEAWLLARGWTLSSESGLWKFYALERDGAVAGRAKFPKPTDAEDYGQAVVFALARIALVAGVPAHEVFFDVLSASGPWDAPDATRENGGDRG